MTATITPTTATTTAAGPAAGSTRTRPLWKAGAGAGLIAAAATVAVAAAAHGVGVKLETGPGDVIPILGFGQLTLFFTAVGVLIAGGIRRRAGRPRATLVRTTVALTALSLIPDVLISAGVATKATFMLTHLVAAAIVIPVLTSRLPEQRTS